MSQHPTFEQVNSLPEIFRGTVPESFIDRNGHMNIRHYLELGAHSADKLCIAAGMDDNYVDERKLGVFTINNHLQYFSELRLGEEYTTHSLTLGRSSKALHMVSILLDQQRQKVSNVFETLLIHMDMEQRRPTEFPDDVAEILDQQITQSKRLQWPIPVSGSIAIKHHNSRA